MEREDGRGKGGSERQNGDSQPATEVFEVDEGHEIDELGESRIRPRPFRAGRATAEREGKAGGREGNDGPRHLYGRRCVKADARRRSGTRIPCSHHSHASCSRSERAYDLAKSGDADLVRQGAQNPYQAEVDNIAAVEE